MTLQPEVTTFWGRLGSFGKKTIFRKKWGSWDAFPVLEGTIVVKNLTMGWANQNFGFCVELHRVCNLLLNTPFIPPLHRDCDPSASLVRPLTWPGRRWRHRGGRVVALVAQRWHTGRPGLAMVAVEFWACSNSRTRVAEDLGRSGVDVKRQQGGTRIAVVAEWMHNGRPMVALTKNVFTL